MNRRPGVTITFAQSLDGRIATKAGVSQWISGSETLELAHQRRNDHDAILVGVGTVLADNPQLTCRLPGGSSPLRVVIDSEVRTPASATLVQTTREVPTLLFASARHARERAADLKSHGAVVVVVAETEPGRLDLSEVLAVLAERGIESVLVEGGSAIITSMIAANLWDRLIVVLAPMIIGEGTSSVGDLGVVDLANAPRARTVRVYQAGEDVVWEMERRP
ncbi:MAG: RibD family protein [Spirochaetia bacterium]